MAGEPRLQFEGARRAFGGRTALAGVDLTLFAGEIYTLLGRNGAGKTTLVRAASGRVRLDGGSVRLLGRDPRTDPAVRRRLGLAPQDIALYPELTVRENLDALARLAGLPRRAARAAADEALGWIGLEDRARSRVGTLSGGMKRRVNLAAGVLHQPDVLLLDEPTVGLDPQSRERIHELLSDLRARGMALLLTTHDLPQAAALADRIGILDEGRRLAEGTLAELIASTFGAQRQLSLTLAAPPAPSVQDELRRLDLSPAGDELHWAGSVGDEFAGLARVGERLRALGVAVAELKLRAPDLYSVYFQVTGKELVE